LYAIDIPKITNFIGKPGHYPALKKHIVLFSNPPRSRLHIQAFFVALSTSVMKELLLLQKLFNNPA